MIPKTPQSRPPLGLDEVVRRDNVIKRLKQPNELQSLKSTNSLTMLGESKDVKLESSFNKIDLQQEGTAAWNTSGRNIIRGLPGREAGRLSLDEVRKTKGVEHST